jgi:hypothetical protein
VRLHPEFRRIDDLEQHVACFDDLADSRIRQRDHAADGSNHGLPPRDARQQFLALARQRLDLTPYFVDLDLRNRARRDHVA